MRTPRVLPFLIAASLCLLTMQAQDIRTNLTVFDNTGNSGTLTVGINPSATDGVDGGLGEFVLGAPPPAGTFDVRLIDNDLRTPSLLGNGVLTDLRGIYSAPPVVQTFEVRVRRSSFATSTFMGWTLPLQAGITNARLVSYPDQSLLDLDMATVSQVVLPTGVGRFMVTITYGGPVLQRYTLSTTADPAAVGFVNVFPAQADYASGATVNITAVPTDTCWAFSHWTGDASGSLQSMMLTMNGNKSVTAHFVKRSFPVTVSSLAPFSVNPGAPPPQSLVISNSGLACYSWTASASQPWIGLSRTSGSGDGTISVSIDPSQIPCAGTHQGLISITSDASTPGTVTVPVTVNVGTPTISSRTLGAPVLLTCQSKANDLLIVTIFNQGQQPVTFPTAPVPGAGFVLKNPAAFPLTVNAQDSANVYFEFAPGSTQSGVITDNIILTSSACGHQVLLTLVGTRVAPTILANTTDLDFGTVYDCASEPLPSGSVTLRNAWTGAAQLRYTVPAGITLTAAPALIAGASTAVVTVQPARTGSPVISGILTIEADYGVCTETMTVNLQGLRKHASFRAEAVATPGSLPAQQFDSTCVGGYSAAKSIRLINDGTADLTMSLSIAPPFEIEAFGSTFTLAAGTQQVINLRFHPTVGGSFTSTFTMTADHCSLSSSVSLGGATFTPQVLTTTVDPAFVSLANCDSSARIKVSISNNGTAPAVFSTLPALPSGFAWDGSVSLPVIIPANPATPFEAYVTFRPPVGQGGAFGGSVQWFGQPCGTSAYFTLSGERLLPAVTLSAIDTFYVNAVPPAPQQLTITGGPGASCYKWTAAATKPWIMLSKTSGTGDDAITVNVLTSAIPCQGTHAGSIDITLTGTSPLVLHVPVVAVVGRADLAVRVLGSPVILSCQSKASDLITVTILNNGGASVTFPTAPVFGSGFAVKNPAAFPLTIASRDSASFFVEFAPATSQNGRITANAVLSTAGCGSDLLVQVTGTRIAPILTATPSSLSFGEVHACASDTLPVMSLTVVNAYLTPVALRYTVPAGMELVAAPTSIAASSSDVVSVRPAAKTTADISGLLRIDGDYGVCVESLTFPVEAHVRESSMIVEAVDSPGQLPPQIFDTTCVGAYSQPRKVRIRNTGSDILRVAVTVAAPFETDAFSTLFPLAPNEERILELRFHPTAAGVFNTTFTVNADPCALTSTVQLTGVTSAQQLLTATLAPTTATLVNCEPGTKIRLSITNTGTSTIVFDSLPALPTGFVWDSSIVLPISIPPRPTQPFDTYIRFEPPSDATGSYGGSVQWFGAPCGTTVYFRLAGERVQPRMVVAPVRVDFGSFVWCATTVTGPRKQVTVTNTSTLPVVLTASAPSSRYNLYNGAATFPQAGLALAAGRSQVVDIEALPAGGGAFADTLFIGVLAGTTGNCEQTFAIALTGERYRPAFVLKEANESTNFGDVCVQSTLVRTFIAENIGDRQLTLRAQALPNGSPFSFLQTPLVISLNPGESKPFAVRFAPTAQAVSTQLLVFRSDACTDSVAMLMTGRGVRPVFAIDSVSPSSLTVLTCERPMSKQIRVMVHNTGTDPVTIADASVPPAGFVFDPVGQFPIQLAAGQSRAVTLRFTATDPGSYGGMITFRGSACGAEAGAAVQARVLDASVSIPRDEIAFGDFVVCPSGEVRISDQDRLVQTIVVHNTGDVPVGIDVALSPLNGAVKLILPATPSVIVSPGATQNIAIGLSPTIDSTVSVFAGSIDLVLHRDPACMPEYVTIPYSGRILRSKFGFTADTIAARVTCVTQPVFLQARLTNTGTAPETFRLALTGAPGFTLADSNATVQLTPGMSTYVTVRYTPDSSTASATATLIATNAHCSWKESVMLHVDLQTQLVHLSTLRTGGTQATWTARPGDFIDIPVMLDSSVACVTQHATVRFDLQFDVFALAPVMATSAQGTASMVRAAPDRISVAVTNASMNAGELARIRMEVLVGRTPSTTFSFLNPRVEPLFARLAIDSGSTGLVLINPRNGVTTLDDLGIAGLHPPRPNLLTGSNGQSSVTVTVEHEGYIELALHDRLGIAVAKIHSGILTAGPHTFTINTDGLPSGLYLVTMRTGSDIHTQKLILAR